MAPCSILFAQQARLIQSGTIEFEKRVNMYAVFKKAGTSEKEYDYYKNSHPQFFTSKGNLLFSNNKTLYIPKVMGQPELINNVTPFPFAGQMNLTYTDLSMKSSITQKKIFEETFLVKDSVRKIKWKITDEFREVAGYTCRRANALILDSIYVVAFYTNEIHFSGGPESFAGLPGMILEVALPHDNVTWRATKITDEAIPPQSIVSPQKGKVINDQQLKEWVKSSIKGLNLRLRDLLIKSLLI